MLTPPIPMDNQLTKRNIVPSREIRSTDLPYCLTTQFQLRIANIGESSPNRGEGKKTGIWCPYEQND